MLGRNVGVAAVALAAALMLGMGRTTESVNASQAIRSAVATSDGTDVFVFGTVVGAAKRQLTAAWDDTTAGQLERAYCISHVSVDVNTHPITGSRIIAVLVDSITMPTVVRMASPKRIEYGCPKNQPTIHVHTPSTCFTAIDGTTDPANCVIGGPFAWFCGFSTTDLQTYTRMQLPFQVVQCDRNAFVFWWNPKAV